MRIAVIAVQGDVAEHIKMTNAALAHIGIDGEAIPATSKSEAESCDAFILPGGESTTISKLAYRSSITSVLKKAAKDGKPVMGTCAGSILLAKKGDEQIAKTKIQLLNLMNITVKRNAFGRQRESFQIPLEVKHIGSFDCIFIRAPVFTQVGRDVEILATYHEHIVAARQDSLLAISFHPELTGDTRIHEYFIRMIQ